MLSVLHLNNLTLFEPSIPCVIVHILSGYQLIVINVLELFVCSALYYLYVLIRKFSNCSTRVKKQLFQAFCTNFYCTHLWWSYSKETLRKTTVAYNNTLRFLLGYQRFCSASGMFIECNLDNFATIRRRYIYNFKAELEHLATA